MYSKKNSTILSQTITTQQLIAADYRYNYSNAELLEDWQKLCSATIYKTGSQFKPGMKLCQHYMTNFWDICNSDGKSFAVAWHDPQIMDRVRLWGLRSMNKLWLSWIRRAVYMAAGLPNSSFYRPHFSKQIIEMSGKKHGTLFDPCAGWGGRMLGTIAAGWKYYGCEPNSDTYANLQKMIDFIKAWSTTHIAPMPVEMYDIAALRNIDIVLTSPPYYNLEVYNTSVDQSYNKHNTYDVWRSKWLEPLIHRCLDVLHHDGISAWNVMTVGKYDLPQHVIDVHKIRGWTLVDTVGFTSPLANIRKLKNKDITYIFRKA